MSTIIFNSLYFFLNFLLLTLYCLFKFYYTIIFVIYNSQFFAKHIKLISYIFKFFVSRETNTTSIAVSTTSLFKQAFNHFASCLFLTPFLCYFLSLFLPLQKKQLWLPRFSLCSNAFVIHSGWFLLQSFEQIN